MNSVNLLGNITRDIELKYTPSNMAIASFGLALNKRVKNQQGGYDDKPIFVDVTAFGKTAETVNNYFSKGKKIAIEGELNFESWQDQSGQKRSKLSVIANRIHFVDKRETQGNNSQNYQHQQNGGNQQQPNYNTPQSYSGQPQQQQHAYNSDGQANPNYDPNPKQQHTDYQKTQQQHQYQQPTSPMQNDQHQAPDNGQPPEHPGQEQIPF